MVDYFMKGFKSMSRSPMFKKKTGKQPTKTYVLKEKSQDLELEKFN